MKKKLAIILAIIVVITSITSVSLYSYAQTSGTVGDLTWSYNDNATLTIKGNGYGKNYTFGTSLPWYKYRSSLRAVVVDEGVQALGDNWFNGNYSKLVSIALPDTLLKLGKSCFKGCSVLEDITLPAGCTELYDGVFQNCTSLKYIKLPDDNIYNHSVSEDMFNGCKSLDRVVVGKDYTSIASTAFKGCVNLKSLVWINATFYSPIENPFVDNTSLSIFAPAESEIFDYMYDTRIGVDYPSMYCFDNDHSFSSLTQGTKCQRCDKIYGESSIFDLGEHQYSYQSCNGEYLLYSCEECGEKDVLFDIDGLLNSFDYNKVNGVADGRFDIVKDGVINAKDYSALHNIHNNIYTGYEMQLTNENAIPSAVAVFDYMKSVYKTNVITGQQESTWVGGADYEINYIYNNTGKKPAIRGLDFMGDDFNGVVSRAKAWYNQGGIVSICWHCSSAFDKSYDACKADELTAEQWDKVLTPGTSEYNSFIKGMDKAGSALQELQKAGVPVLWRPFHEFDGAWFWWGKGGSENFKKLWQLMYNHYTYDLGLNNLIWVLGYSHDSYDWGNDIRQWYPGNDYVDIIGADSYEVNENGAERRLYNPVKSICNDSKMIVLHETGKIPTVSQFKSVPWGYFLTWHTTYITQDNAVNELNELYNSDYAITLDELPSFK